MSAKKAPPTDEEMRYDATAYWADDPIPPRNPARKDAEARWDTWIAAHDEAVGDRAISKYRRRQRRIIVVMWVTIALNLTAATLNLLARL